MDANLPHLAVQCVHDAGARCEDRPLIRESDFDAPLYHLQQPVWTIVNIDLGELLIVQKAPVMHEVVHELLFAISGLTKVPGRSHSPTMCGQVGAGHRSRA